MSKTDIDTYLFSKGWSFDGRESYPYQWKHAMAPGFVSRDEAFRFTMDHVLDDNEIPYEDMVD